MATIRLITMIQDRQTTRYYRAGMTGTLQSSHTDALGRAVVKAQLDDGALVVLFPHEFELIQEEACTSTAD